MSIAVRSFPGCPSSAHKLGCVGLFLDIPEFSPATNLTLVFFYDLGLHSERPSVSSLAKIVSNVPRSSLEVSVHSCSQAYSNYVQSALITKYHLCLPSIACLSSCLVCVHFLFHLWVICKKTLPLPSKIVPCDKIITSYFLKIPSDS